MSNPRGPMVPHESRVQLDRAKMFRACSTSLQALATIVANADAYVNGELEQVVVEAESLMKQAQDEIKRMKNEPPHSS